MENLFNLIKNKRTLTLKFIFLDVSNKTKSIISEFKQNQK